MPTPLMVNVAGRGLVRDRERARARVKHDAVDLRIERDGEACSYWRTRTLPCRAGPLGTVTGAQLFAVNQSPVAGLAFQVALPAKLLLAVESRSVRMTAAEGRNARSMERRGD